MNVRPFTSTDAPAVIVLWEACGLTRPWNDPQKDIERKLQVQPELFLVADLDGTVIGSVMAGYEGHRGWINYLAVHPDFRRNGIARQLMMHAEEELKAAGCPKINLQIRAENTDAMGFYRALGFDVDEVVSMGKRLVPNGDESDGENHSPTA